MAAINFDATPQGLREGKHHCNWRPVPDDKGKIGKKPWDPEKCCGLAWKKNPLNLITFDEAVARYEAGLGKPERDSLHFGGIGYIISPESDLSCVDLDDKLGPVLNEAGEPTPGARAVLERLKSYSEISPSGKGIHVWCKAHIKGSNITETNFNGISVEMFVRSHHVTLTGRVIPGFKALEDRQGEAQAFYNELKAINAKTEPTREEKKIPNRKDAGKRAYCLKALDDECRILASTSPGNGRAGKGRNNQLNISAVKLSSLFHTGYLDEAETRSRLKAAARSSGLKKGIDATIESGFKKGKSEPRDIPEPERSTKKAREPKVRLPSILITDCQLRDLSAWSIEALVEAQAGNPRIFVRGGALCRIRYDEKGHCVISDMLKEAEFRGVLSRVANYTKLDKNSNVRNATVPIDVVRDILYSVTKWPGILPLSGIVESPVLRSNGTILQEPGYDMASGLYYSSVEPMELTLPPLIQESAKEAAKWLMDEVLVDFPFVDDASKANALAALITPFLRPTINGCVPFYVIDKPTPGTGASLFVELIALISTGRKPDMAGKPHTDEEMTKIITAILRKSPALVILDNLTGVFGFASFSRMLTAQVWSERLLGVNQQLSLPNLACWYGTANNVKFGGDIPRRKYWSRIDANMGRPQDRMVFRHVGIANWVIEHRPEIVSKIVTICAAWFAANKPKVEITPMGSFEEWTYTLAGVLGYAGIIGFLDNRENTTLDVDDTELAEFFASWYIIYQDSEVSGDEIFDSLTEFNPTDSDTERFQKSMPNELSAKISRGGKSANPLRYFLRTYRDRIFSNGLKLVGSVQDSAKNKPIRWRIISTKTASDDIPSQQATQNGMNGMDYANAQKISEDSLYTPGGNDTVHPVNASPDATGCPPLSVENQESPFSGKLSSSPGPKKANIPKSVEDVVAYIDRNMTEIETPVLHDYLTKCGFSYVAATCQLTERGWKLDLATRTMTKEATTA